MQCARWIGGKVEGQFLFPGRGGGGKQPMRCGRFERYWAQAQDGALDSRRLMLLEKHLDTCARCARLVDALEGLDAVLDEVVNGPVTPPPYLGSRIRAGLEGTQPARPKSRQWEARWLRPLFAGAMVAVAFLLGALTRELHQLNRWLRTGRSQPVVIEFQAPGAREVRLVGDFNAWGREEAPVRVIRSGDRWVFKLTLEPGRYRYAFVVDGRKWLPDPRAPGIIPDGFGGRNSVLYVTPRQDLLSRSL